MSDFYVFVDVVREARAHLRRCSGVTDDDGTECEQCAEAVDVLDEYRRVSARRDQ
jgi:hypothetical protein